jgi:hypothetical protein
MNNRNLILFSALAMLTCASWLIGNEVLLPGSKLLSVLMTVAYPASFILAAGALAGAATRSAFFKASDGLVSLKLTGLIVIGVLAIVMLAHNRGGTLIHSLCWYSSISFVLAYVFLLIIRSRTTP